MRYWGLGLGIGRTGEFMKVKLLFISLLLGISGCAESPERHLNRVHKHKLKNSAPAYAEGYKDGCASGNYLAGDKRYAFKKNALRTQQDTLYSRGWRDGQHICHHEARERLSSNERLHNRIYHRGQSQHSTFSRTGDAEHGGSLHTEEEYAIWETLKK
jgi:hypothetical protein